MVAKLHEFLLCTLNQKKFLQLHKEPFIYDNKGRPEKRIFGKQILICATVKAGQVVKLKTGVRISPLQIKANV